MVHGAVATWRDPRYQSFIELMEQLRWQDTQNFRWLTGEKERP
jgi:hypothetical protein